MNKVSRSVSWVWVFGATLLVVLALALMPANPLLPTTGSGKANHVAAFSVLTLLGCRAFSTHIRAVLISLLAYGGLIEILQSFTPYRAAEWVDLLADAVGLLAGRLIMRATNSRV